MAEEKRTYESEAPALADLKLRQRPVKTAEEQKEKARPSPAAGAALPYSRDLVLKLIERFKRI